MEKVILQLKVTNSFLLKAGEKYVLIDTGYDYEWETFCAQVQAAGVSLSDISHLILTHHHEDHCGLLNKIVASNPEIRVVVSCLARDLLLAGRNVHTPGGGYLNRRVALLLRLKAIFDKQWTHTFPPYTVRPNDILITGETRLRDIGINLDGCIIATPGHSIDSMTVVLDDGDAFVGDAAANLLQFAGAKYCVISLDDHDAYYASWQRIMAAKARQIFPAHGQPFPVERLAQNLGKNKQESMVVIF